MKKTLLAAPLIGLVALLSFGLLSLQSANSSPDDGAKREDDIPELVLIDDEDDDDTKDPKDKSLTTPSKNDVASRNADNTKSRVEPASRVSTVSRNDTAVKAPVKQPAPDVSNNDVSRDVSNNDASNDNTNNDASNDNTND